MFTIQNGGISGGLQFAPVVCLWTQSRGLPARRFIESGRSASFAVTVKPDEKKALDRAESEALKDFSK
jgi:hypothetical protein